MIVIINKNKQKDLIEQVQKVVIDKLLAQGLTQGIIEDWED